MPRPKNKKTTTDLIGAPPKDGTRRKRMRLTQAIADAATPAWHENLDTIWDDQTKPLHIKIRKGSCTWAYRARIGLEAKQTDITIGPVGDVSMTKVREVVDSIIKPALRRKEDPRPAVFADVNGGPKATPPAPVIGWTFGEMVEHYLSRKLEGSGKKSHQEYKSAYGRQELTALQTKAAAEVSRADMAAVRDGIVTTTSAGRAITVLRYISEMYQWAVGEPNAALPEGYNPTKGINMPRLPEIANDDETEEETGRFLSPEELSLTLQAIAATEMDFGVRMALLFALASGQRRWSIVQAEVSQIRDTEERGTYWFAPARIMKARREHVLPLPPIVVRLIEAAKRHAIRLNSKWLFPSVRRSYGGEERDAHINEGALNSVLYRMFAPDPVLSPPEQRASKKKQSFKQQGMLNVLGVGEWTPHDVRRTMTTNLVPLGVQEWHVSLLLAHSIADTEHSRSRTTQKHYNCYKYYLEKQAAAEKWCGLLEGWGLTTAYLEALEAAEVKAWEQRQAKRERRLKAKAAKVNETDSAAA